MDDLKPFQEELLELINLKTALKLFNKHIEISLLKRIIQTYSSFIILIIIWSDKEKIQNMAISQFSYHHALNIMNYLKTTKKKLIVPIINM